MPANKYRKLIVDLLQGKSPELRNIPPDRLDWNGPGALLELYDQTSGKDRQAIIQAIGAILQEHTAPVPVLAQLVDIASGLDLAEIEPIVRALQSEDIASEEQLRQSITNYLAYRKLMSNGQAIPATPGPSRSPTKDRQRKLRKGGAQKP
jgi:hypothetical protein